MFSNNETNKKVKVKNTSHPTPSLIIPSSWRSSRVSTMTSQALRDVPGNRLSARADHPVSQRFHILFSFSNVVLGNSQICTFSMQNKKTKYPVFIMFLIVCNPDNLSFWTFHHNLHQLYCVNQSNYIQLMGDIFCKYFSSCKLYTHKCQELFPNHVQLVKRRRQRDICYVVLLSVRSFVGKGNAPALLH